VNIHITNTYNTYIDVSALGELLVDIGDVLSTNRPPHDRKL